MGAVCLPFYSNYIARNVTTELLMDLEPSKHEGK